jgi:hypothetical protein
VGNAREIPAKKPYAMPHPISKSSVKVESTCLARVGIPKLYSMLATKLPAEYAADLAISRSGFEIEDESTLFTG